jgi:hypothetical protein
MTDIEPTAKAWMDAVQTEVPFMNRLSVATIALQRALLEIEVKKQELRDFKQKVSDAVETYKADNPFTYNAFLIDRFIIPAPKPDPLVEVIKAMQAEPTTYVTREVYANRINAALEARGFEIREKGQ